MRRLREERKKEMKYRAAIITNGWEREKVKGKCKVERSQANFPMQNSQQNFI